MTKTSTNAQAVSAFIRRTTNYRPVPRGREGVHVTRSSRGARVSYDFDHASDAVDARNALLGAFQGSGYVIESMTVDGFTVTGRIVTNPDAPSVGDTVTVPFSNAWGTKLITGTVREVMAFGHMVSVQVTPGGPSVMAYTSHIVSEV